jgi:hypothetical protein
MNKSKSKVNQTENKSKSEKTETKFLVTRYDVYNCVPIWKDNLNHTDLAIIEEIFRLCKSKNVKIDVLRIKEDGDNYTWVSNSLILYIPFIGTNRLATIIKHMQKIEALMLFKTVLGAEKRKYYCPSPILYFLHNTVHKINDLNSTSKEKRDAQKEYDSKITKEDILKFNEEATESFNKYQRQMKSDSKRRKAGEKGNLRDNDELKARKNLNKGKSIRTATINDLSKITEPTVQSFNKKRPPQTEEEWNEWGRRSREREENNEF